MVKTIDIKTWTAKQNKCNSRFSESNKSECAFNFNLADVGSVKCSYT